MLQARLHFARAICLFDYGSRQRATDTTCLNTSMAGVYWCYPLRTLFSSQFNAVIETALVAARICHRIQHVPYVPPEIWAGI
jgi:hypothetical protein